VQISILIVSHNRKCELDKTLTILSELIDFTKNELLVFLDGCTDGSEQLKERYTLVRWFISPTNLGASAARRELYKQAKGEFLIGFDDDAHPLTIDFIPKIQSYFYNNQALAILAFEEVRGIYATDEEAFLNSKAQKIEYFTAEFVGSGFAIRKAHYDLTDGFPSWIDIYGEESCVSLQVLELGFDILYTNSIKVNHRVNISERLKKGKNYFRFQKQLKNETFFYLVYYPNPFKNLLRLYWHNFKKYAIKDWKFFQMYLSTIFVVLYSLPTILKHRKPVRLETIKKRVDLYRV